MTTTKEKMNYIQRLLPSGWKLKDGYLIAEDNSERYVLKDDGTIDLFKVSIVLDNYGHTSHAKAIYSKEYAALLAVAEAAKELQSFLESYPHQHSVDISGYEESLSQALSKLN